MICDTEVCFRRVLWGIIGIGEHSFVSDLKFSNLHNNIYITNTNYMCIKNLIIALVVMVSTCWVGGLYIE